MFAQALVRLLIACWAGALALSALGFLTQALLQPLLPDYAAEEWHRWAVAGGVIIAATFLAVGWAIWRSP